MTEWLDKLLRIIEGPGPFEESTKKQAMIRLIPAFKMGVHYREISPDEGKRRWRYQLLRPLRIELDLPLRDVISFRDRDGREWAFLDGNRLEISSRYTWNGCSPKRWVPIAGWIGTPDTPRNTLASCVHDVLCQFRDCQHFPLSREMVDLCFREILEKSRFMFAGTFWGAVADAGWIFKTPPDGSHSVLIPRAEEVA